MAKLAIFLLIGFLGISSAHAAPLRTESEQLWLQELQQEAIDSGISEQVVHEALDNFEPDPRVIELDQKQPEGTVTFETYRRNVVTPARIAKGIALMDEYADALAALEEKTGVPPEVVVALWGIESSYGARMGGYETINALATLAFDGRRASFFRMQLISALQILEAERMNAADMRGSWAGAMGQCQFMPKTYLNYAVDGNGDGTRDIWNDPLDALASIANYLRAEGWQRDLRWGREVAGGAVQPTDVGLGQTKSLRQWAAMGLKNADGAPLPSRDIEASFLQPDGSGTSGFLVYENLKALLRWNRSTYFALSVGVLADSLAQH